MNFNKKFKIRLAALCFLLIIMITAVVGGTRFYSYLDDFGKGKNIVEPIISKDSNAPVNILLMGVDIGEGVKSSSKYKRTDTLMLLNYNPEGNKINVLSIPRDTLIRIKGKNEKINAAHVYGGVPWTIEAVQQLLNVKVNYYGKVDYAGFRKIIDIIGGIDIKITQNMDYDDKAQNLHIHFKKGETVHLDGKKAEEFFRWRKNNDGTGLAMGDLGRIDNQHEFLDKVFEKVVSPAIITKIPKMLKAMPDYIETNMSGRDIVKYGVAFSKVEKENFKMSTVKGDSKYIGGISYFIYNEDKNKDIAALLK